MKSARERARELIGWMTTLKAIEGALLESERIGEEREHERCISIITSFAAEMQTAMERATSLGVSSIFHKRESDKETCDKLESLIRARNNDQRKK